MGYFNEQTITNQVAYNQWSKAVNKPKPQISIRERNILEWRCECGEKLPEDATTPGEMIRDVNHEVVDYDENEDGTYTPRYDDVVRLIYYAPEWECIACGREYSADDYDKYRIWSAE